MNLKIRPFGKRPSAGCNPSQKWHEFPSEYGAQLPEKRPSALGVRIKNGMTQSNTENVSCINELLVYFPCLYINPPEAQSRQWTILQLEKPVGVEMNTYFREKASSGAQTCKAR